MLSYIGIRINTFLIVIILKYFISGFKDKHPRSEIMALATALLLKFIYINIIIGLF